MASKGNFRLIQDFALYRVVEDIEWEPWPTSLSYLKKNPNITITFDISPERVRASLKELEVYRDELLEEAAQEAQQVEINKNQSLADRVINSYTNAEKIKTLQKRKTIHETLTIAALINQFLERKILTINNRKLELVDSEVQTYGFLQQREPYTSMIKNLLQSQ